MTKDLYNTLGISRSSSQDEIKKAYKKMAIKWHPDKNPDNVEEATNKFKEITEAYEILSDDKKKQIYDDMGYDAVSGSAGPNMDMSGNFADLNEMFGGAFGGLPFNMFGGRRQQETKNTMKMNLDITLEEVYKGCVKNISIPIKEKCDTCEGYGTNDKTSNSCNQCKGSGFVMQISQMGNMIQQRQVLCNNCKGSGSKRKENNSCKKCDGFGTVDGKLEKSITIKPNFDYTTKFPMKDKGSYNVKLRVHDDIIIEVKINDDKFKIANKYDLYYEHNIEINDALTGNGHNLDHPINKIFIESKDVIKDKDLRVINGYGLPYGNNKYGNLIIKYLYIYPNRLINTTNKKTSENKHVYSIKYTQQQDDEDDDNHHGRQQECRTQ